MQHNKWVTTVTYPEAVREAVHTANATWKRFCELPAERKASLGFENFGGYELKTHENHHDSKELFHFTLLKTEELKAKGSDWPEAEKQLLNELLEQSAAVIEAAKAIVTDYLEPHDGGLTESALSQIKTWPIRYLHYFPAAPDVAETAHAHCDVGGCTLHLYQDYNGLEYLDETDWKPVPLSADTTSILPGMDIQYLTQGATIATCHRVVPTAETAQSGRFSSVLFINFDTDRRWNKEKYGSLGKQTPGWNYKLDHESFANYFITGEDLSSI